MDWFTHIRNKLNIKPKLVDKQQLIKREGIDFDLMMGEIRREWKPEKLAGHNDPEIVTRMPKGYWRIEDERVKNVRYRR